MATIDNTIQDLGNGLGFIYQTKPDGTTITTNEQNTFAGVQKMKLLALTDAPLASEITARCNIEFGGAAGQLDAITINAITVLTGPITGASVADIVSAAADYINANASTPNYHAYPSGNDLVIFADTGTGDTPNAFAVTVTVSAGLTEDSTDMHGGQDAQDIYDTEYGHRYFLNANYDSNFVAGQGTASQGVLGNEVEVTRYFVHAGFQGHIHKIEKTIISNGRLGFITRSSSIMNILVETNGLAATDNMDNIDTMGFNEGDIILIRGKDPLRITTARHLQGSAGNLVLSNGVNWASGNYNSCLVLQYWNQSLGPRWYEISRSPDISASVSNMRGADIPQPASGADVITLTAGGGTVTLVPGTDEEVQQINGSPALVGSWVIQGGGTPIDGDKFWFEYTATPTVAANTVTIFGQTLTTKQAQGTYPTWILARYIGSAAAWVTSVMIDAAGQDYEPDPGNPGTNGEVLSSTAAGVRSWAENPADASVTTPKLADDGIRDELFPIYPSFETGETGTFQFTLPFACTITAVRGEVRKAIAATDDGTIDFQDNSLAAMTTMTVSASSVVGTNFANVVTSNNAFTVGQVLTMVVAKPTAGGKMKLELTIRRANP